MAGQRLDEFLLCADSLVVRRLTYDHLEYAVYQLLYLLVFVVAKVCQINSYQTYLKNVRVYHQLFLSFYDVVQHLHDVYDVPPVVHRSQLFQNAHYYNVLRLQILYRVLPRLKPLQHFVEQKLAE